MIFIIKNDLLKGVPVHIFLRKCGYMPFRNSFIRYLTKLEYPRFHIFVNSKNDFHEFSLHLDMKKPVYFGVNAHAGEYNGDVLEQEKQRIFKIINLL